MRITGGFGVGLLNDARQILPRSTPVAMATKFETKSVITRLVYEIGDLCVQHGVFGVGLLNDVTQISPRPTLIAMATTFETKWAITQLVWEISLRYLRL